MIRKLSMLIVILGLSACASEPKTSSMVDPGADLTAYSTFNFVQYDQEPDKGYETLELNYLRQATQRQLERRGYTMSENPDFVVNFSLDTKEKVRTRSVPTAGYGIGYDPYYDVYYDDWYTTHQTRVDQYTEGYLDIDLIDVAQRKLVWQGSTQGRLTSKDFENAQATLEQAVAEVFTQFPGGS